MTPKLRKQVMKKAEDTFLNTLRVMLGGFGAVALKKREQQYKWLWKNSPTYKRLVKALPRVPDSQFEVLCAGIEATPGELRKVLGKGIGYLPANRGGRPAAFSLEIRRRAIQDIGNEYSRCDTFAEAVNLVAARYKMTPEYLRKVWKNRKRLRKE